MDVQLRKRKIGIGLIIGIVIFPMIFSWLLLRNGYSNKSRIVSFGWMIFALLLPFISMDETTSSASQNTNKIECHEFKIDAKLLDGKLLVSLKTDLPDSTEVSIDVSRSYFAVLRQQEYSISYFNQISTVGEWRSVKSIDIHDSILVKNWNNHKRKMAKADECDIKIAKISDDFVASFTVFGTDNTNIVSDKNVARSIFGSIHADYKVKRPLDNVKNLNVDEFGCPSSLKMEKVYELESSTPLMPERRPSDAMSALTLTKKMLSKTKIKVVTIDDSDSTPNPWYQVKVLNSKNKAIATGWINSVALIGQTLKIIKDY